MFYCFVFFGKLKQFLLRGESLRVPVTQFCSVQPPPGGPESIGSDWTGVGRKASILLLCTRVIIDLNPPGLLCGAGEEQRAAGGGVDPSERLN